jgi:hypothetical protein
MVIVDGDRVLIDVIVVRMMHVPVVEIVDVPVVANCRVPAIGTVIMLVLLMDVMTHPPTVRPASNRAKRMRARNVLARGNTMIRSMLRSGGVALAARLVATPITCAHSPLPAEVPAEPKGPAELHRLQHGRPRSTLVAARVNAPEHSRAPKRSLLASKPVPERSCQAGRFVVPCR